MMIIEELYIYRDRRNHCLAVVADDLKFIPFRIVELVR